jgi:hypothetical protein
VCAGKKYTSLSQPIKVWRLCVRMTAQTAYPVIQIINSDKKYVGPLAADTSLQSPIRQYKPAGSNRCTFLQKITPIHNSLLQKVSSA